MAGNLYALLVGIDSYSAHGPQPPLRGCVADVRAMCEFLIDGLGVPEKHICLLTNEQATRTAIVDGWQTHLRDRATAGDLVFFHYSGHGSQSRSDDPTEPDGFAESLVAYDSRDDGQFDLLDKELGVLIAEVEEKGAQVTLVMDCCHSGHITRTLAKDRPMVRQCARDRRPRPQESVLGEPAATTHA